MFTQECGEFDLHARAILDFTIPKIEICKKLSQLFSQIKMQKVSF